MTAHAGSQPGRIVDSAAHACPRQACAAACLRQRCVRRRPHAGSDRQANGTVRYWRSDRAAAKLVPTPLRAVAAAVLPHQPYLLTKGNVLPRVLQTAINSTLPGFVTCRLTQDVVGKTGITLLDRGTLVVGETRGGMQQGQARFFVPWTPAETPAGVVVELDSPAADPLGRTGFAGNVDNHFWERLGGTLCSPSCRAACSRPYRRAPAAAPSTRPASRACRATPSIARSTSRPHSARTRANLFPISWHGTPTLVASAALPPCQARYRDPGRRADARVLVAPLARFLDDPGMTEIVVNRPGEIGVERQGQWAWYEQPELTFDRLHGIATLAATMSQQDLGPTLPLSATILPDGQHVQICRPSAVAAGTISLTIRRPSAVTHDLGALAAGGLFAGTEAAGPVRHPLDQELVRLYQAGELGAFLKTAVRARKTIIITGDTGSGKTTLAKALVSEIPLGERLVTIEDTAEFVGLRHRNVVSLFSPKAGRASRRCDRRSRSRPRCACGPIVCSCRSCATGLLSRLSEASQPDTLAALPPAMPVVLKVRSMRSGS